MESPAMKTLVFAFAMFVTSAFAAIEEATPADLKNVPSVDLVTIADKLPLYDGKLVKVKFASRHQEVEKTDDGDYLGTIDFWNKSENYGSMAVFLPKEALNWFMRVKTDVMAKRSVWVYARVINYHGVAAAQLLGTELRTELKGQRLVWAQ